MSEVATALWPTGYGKRFVTFCYPKSSTICASKHLIVHCCLRSPLLVDTLNISNAMDVIPYFSIRNQFALDVALVKHYLSSDLDYPSL